MNPSPLPAWLPKPGEILLQRYRLDEVLGQGGQGVVYGGWHLTLQVPIALKVLLDRSESNVKRFEREAQLAAQLDHPNVVRLYDFGTLPGGEPYMVMKRLHGRTLGEELDRQGPLARPRLLALFGPCLDGLAEAHARGVIHKDLKPDNLFLSEPGTPQERLCILDFGIARVQGPDPDAPSPSPIAGRLGTLTSGNPIGTPQYMAPEYLLGAPISPAVDVYQMGLILAEAATGQRVVAPSVSTPSELWLRCAMLHMTEGTVQARLREVTAHDLALGQLLLRASAHNPSQRYPSARELREALRALEDRKTRLEPQAQPPAPTRVEPEPARRTVAEPAAEPARATLAEQGPVAWGAQAAAPQAQDRGPSSGNLAARPRAASAPATPRAPTELEPSLSAIFTPPPAGPRELPPGAPHPQPKKRGGRWAVGCAMAAMLLAALAIFAFVGVRVYLDREAAPSHKPFPVVRPLESKPAQAPQADAPLGEGVRVPPGRFWMGSPERELGRNADETLHEVKLTRPFWLQRTELTQREWTHLMGSNPAPGVPCPSCPVRRITWFEAVAYANARSQAEGLPPCYLNASGRAYGTADAAASREPSWPRGLDCEGYRLPTEAEWEYAARAGTQGPHYGERLSAVAWTALDGDLPRPVAQKQPNAWGLYDTVGNEFEWCWDWLGPYPKGPVVDPLGPPSGKQRVGRGGTWGKGEGNARAALRGRAKPDNRSIGLRLARTLPP